MGTNLNLRALLISVLLLLALLGIWQVASQSSASASASNLSAEQVEYLKMLGKDPGAQKQGGFPTPAEMGQAAWKHLADPFYDRGPND